MFLTETDLINTKLALGAKINESDIIKHIVNDDINNPKKRIMQDGERYYSYEHDIHGKNFRQETLYGTREVGDKDEEYKEIFINPNRSNYHVVNPFHRILTDQKTSYIVGKEPTIVVRGAEEDSELKFYEKILTGVANEDFNDTIQDLVTGASNKGIEVLHVYYNNDGALRYCIIPANEMIMVYDTSHQSELEECIRYYDITVVRGGEKFLQKRVEWWTKETVTYYIEDDNHNFKLDTTCLHNPSPHWWSITTVDGMQKNREAHSWGKLPFVVLKNNSKCTTDLQGIKGLIDAYDLISSEGTNNMLDLVELYWSIVGYGGETASAIAKKIKVNKAMQVNEPSGKVEAKQVDLPMAGRLEWLKMLRKDIYHFGQGVDTDTDKFGNAPSGVSLKFQYTLLDLKANAMIAKLKKAIKEFFWFITDDYNRMNSTHYDSTLIDITINKSTITNDSETVQMIQASEGIVSEKTLLARHPFVDDVNAELTELEAQREKEKTEMDNYKDNFPGKKPIGDVNGEQ